MYLHLQPDPQIHQLQGRASVDPQPFFSQETSNKTPSFAYITTSHNVKHNRAYQHQQWERSNSENPHLGQRPTTT